jgi:uncharacterized protein (TIGR03435 family)
VRHRAIHAFGPILVVACLLAPGMRAQATFDVVSIKPADPKKGYAGSGPSGPLGWSANNFTLLMLIHAAYPEYGGDRDRIVGGPTWIRELRFDVEAKAEAPIAPGAVAAMLRPVLAERFALKTHAEPRLMDVYVARLTRDDGRPGPWLRPTAAEYIKARADGQSRPDTCRAIVKEREATGLKALTLLDLTTSTLFAVFREVGGFDHPIVDRTGLEGFYDVSVAYTSANVLNVSATGTSLTAAAEDQLGLKFERGRDLLDVLVIDSASMPTPN